MEVDMTEQEKDGVAEIWEDSPAGTRHESLPEPHDNPRLQEFILLRRLYRATAHFQHHKAPRARREINHILRELDHIYASTTSPADKPTKGES